ncbi:SEL1-like repeat protein [Pelagimonas varians]|uniref:Beta-lactamase HcpC n=1 Tax=Pelagimonas varians TaxID=696760 RepID=A0A238L0P4_9RHOB|nr:SEL1-like repeat protein [Pelagimonas varians]PYG27238.1 TPR repeat protein [Pelagimonas varians]SMX48664.1 Putative beta-lactamase HcpC precursor [Pelagimonas varians]
MTMRAKLASLLCALMLSSPAAVAQQTAVAGDADLSTITSMAEQGDANAQYALGLKLLEGSGLLQNFALAASWMEKAANQGQMTAANRLGQMYFSGIGVRKDRAKALHWMQTAANAGDSRFIFEYGTVLEKTAQNEDDLGLAAAQYLQAFDMGESAAGVSLAVLLQGGQGVPQDLPAALRIYTQAAEQGDAQAQNNLGLMYVRGEGVDQDYARAFELFDAAAKQGLAVAKGNLAVMYENGFGVDVDEPMAHQLTIDAARSKAEMASVAPVYDARLMPIEANDDTIQLLQVAAQAGDPVAQFQMAWLIVTSAEPGFEQSQMAARLFRASAEAGYPPAMANLGLMYFNGQAVPQDYVLGQMWLVLAGSAGFEPALNMNFAFANRMTPAQTAEAQKMAQAKAEQL